MIQSLANFLRRRQQKWNSGQTLSILAHSSLKVHCSYRLKFFVAKNHLTSSSPSNCSLLCNRFARSCSPRPSQRSKYTEGVALRMRICVAVQRLSRKWVQKKKYAGTSILYQQYNPLLSSLRAVPVSGLSCEGCCPETKSKVGPN